jgi:uncharacterized membrane protein YbhN (UPF0104 family)
MPTPVGALLMDDDPVKAPARRGLHPIVKLGFGLAVGGVALALVVSTAGGIGDALDALRRMRAGFVVLAIVVAAVRVGLYGLQLELLGGRSGRLGIGTAYGLVEAAIPAILHRFGAPLDDALAATLVYRAVGTLLPALAGTLAIALLRRPRTLMPSVAPGVNA